MNYIKEINSFYDLMEREPMSASAVNLWHTLLHINNKAAWIQEFTVPATVLKLKGGLADSSFKRGRKELVERGLIECQSNGRNVAPIYKMKRLFKQGSYASEDKMDSLELDKKREVDQSMNQGTIDKMNPSNNQQMNHQVDQHTTPLNKPKETKQNQRKQTSDAIRFYQENFGVVSPFLAEELLIWIKDVGDAFVMEAMKRSLERGKFNFGYVKGILNGWLKEGVNSVEMLKARESKRRKSSGNGGNWNNRSAQHGEVVPEWFTESKRKRQEQQERIEAHEEVDVEELLKEYKASRVV
jgi:DnaD/phage-associated family protein